jgi:C1A family cysteine protease
MIPKIDTVEDTTIESPNKESSRKYNLCIKRLKQSKMNYAHFSLKLSKGSKNIHPPYVNLYKNHVKEFDIYDQGGLGSCTANAICSAYQFVTPSHDGSRLFLYYNERMISNNIDKDTGATLSCGIKSLQIYGLCLESIWPYLEHNIYTKPHKICYSRALKEKDVQYYNLQHNIHTMKECLLNGFPFVVGIAVFKNFENSTTGIIELPNDTDVMIGGHAVLVCGYNDIEKHWIVRNSWGRKWGDNGYCYLPYEYLLDDSLSTELWCITKHKK